MTPRRDPIRILTLTNLWPFEGFPYGAFVASQARSLERLGVSVDVDFVNGQVNAGAYVAGALRMLALNVRPRRYDLVHAHTGHCGVLARLQWRYPVLVSYWGSDLNGKPRAKGGTTLKSRVESRVFRRLSHVVDATVTQSARMEALLPPSARRRNRVVPAGLDRSLFRPIPRQEARRRLGWRQDEVTVLFVGRSWAAGKRVVVAHAACDIAAREVEGLVFRICEGVDHTQVAVWMNAADVLILPSVAEGSPNVVKEALACNLPVVATDVGDVPELLEGVERCRVLPPSAPAEDFAAALTQVLRDGPKRSDGREKTADLDMQVIAKRLVGIYRAIMRDESPVAIAPSAPDGRARV